MRLTVRAHGREIDIRLRQDDTAALQAAETTALRLLQALPDPPDTDKPPAFGFALGSDTERAEPDPTPDDADEEEEP